MSSRYRADIDGLRAVAIIPVLMCHARVPGFSGGFVGVDVFFVISGFLITQLLRNELEAGRFSVVAFYERRIRRIFPALIAVLLVVSLVASWLLLPQHLAPYGRSLIATSLFASNLFFARIGYFAPAADELPLLHTWSLAVEEQFYIVYPLFLWAIYRRGPRVVLALIAMLALLSLVLAQAMLIENLDAAFYLPFTRAWELALGCMLAIASIAPDSQRWIRDAVGIVGLAMIACAVVLYSDTTPFPGAAALLPCFGTAFVIWAGANGQRHLAGDILTRRPLVLTGLVSYSLYLWHWPLLIFTSYLSVPEPSALAKAGALAASYVLALATWRWVERPFRGRRGVLTRQQLMSGAAAAMSVILMFGWAAHAQRGWPARLEPEVGRIAASHYEHAPIGHSCFSVSAKAVRADRLCRTGHPSASASFIVWGDSHARALVDAVDRAARLSGRGGVMAPHAGCSPLLDIRRSDLPRRSQCNETTAAVLEYLRTRPEIEDVVLISRWALLSEGTFYAPESGEPILLSDRETRVRGRAENRRVFERALSRTVDRLAAAGKRVWIVGPVPEVGVNVPKALANAERFGFEVDIAPSRAEFETRQRVTLAILDRVAAQHGATVVPVHEALCNEDTCRVESLDGRPLYYDDDHLSFTGGRAIVPALQKIFEGRGKLDVGSPARIAELDTRYVSTASSLR
ncbi:MAG: acyltransferase family protein [Woeseiaceae bacterium]